MKPTAVIQYTAMRLECSRCGAEAKASCNCGEAYIPAKVRVAEYDKENPGKSTRQAASDLGISNKTVSQARGVTGVTPETVTGRDGKSYSVKKKSEDAEVSPKEEAKYSFFTVAEFALRIKDVDLSLIKPTEKMREVAESVVAIWTQTQEKLK